MCRLKFCVSALVKQYGIHTVWSTIICHYVTITPGILCVRASDILYGDDHTKAVLDTVTAVKDKVSHTAAVFHGHLPMCVTGILYIQRNLQ